MAPFEHDESSLLMAARATEALAFLEVVNRERKILERELTQAEEGYARICANIRATFANKVIAAYRDSKLRLRELADSE